MLASEIGSTSVNMHHRRPAVAGFNLMVAAVHACTHFIPKGTVCFLGAEVTASDASTSFFSLTLQNCVVSAVVNGDPVVRCSQHHR